MRILVIDDDKTRSIVALKEWNLDVVNILTNVDFVIKHLKDDNYKFHKYDLIILDVKLDSGSYGDLRTNNGLYTGFLLYDDYIRQLDCKVIVWSAILHIVNSLNWGENVVVKVAKDLSDVDQLINLVKSHTK